MIALTCRPTESHDERVEWTTAWNSIQMISLGQPPKHFPCAPWVVLAGWLLIALAAAAYYGLTEWGPGGSLLSLAIYLGFGANVVALAGWATAWLMLSTDSFGSRLAYFALATSGLFLAMYLGQDSPDEALGYLPEFAKLIVGTGTLLFAARRCGWKITASELTARDYGDAYVKGIRFSIFDLFIFTTGVGVFTGLLLADGEAEVTSDFAITSLFVATVVSSVISGLLFRRSWRLAATCFCVAGVIAGWMTAGVLLLLYCGAAQCLLIVTGMLQLAGYRLANS